MTARKDSIGKLTGHRCRHCGACMYLNKDGAFWCSSCDFRSHTLYDSISKYAFVPVPDDHPHIDLFDAVVMNEPIQDGRK